MSAAPIGTAPDAGPIDTDVFDPIEGRCNRPVQECWVCKWRGQNYVGQPCKRCSLSAVIERPCRKYPLVGADGCEKHGWGTPAAKAAAARRSLELAQQGRMGRLLAETGAVDEVRAHEVLARRMAFAEAMARAFEDLVGELDPVGGAGEGRLHDGGRPHVLVGLAREWTDEAARLAKMAADLDIDTARLRLESGEVEQLFGALVRAVAAADLDDAAGARLREALTAELRQLDAVP